MPNRFLNIALLFAIFIINISSKALFKTDSNKEGIHTNTSFEPTFTVSTETTHSIPADQDYIFGYLEVLEDRSDPNSSTIELPVYIFKSRSSNPKSDPIIYTVGGPGSSTMPSAQYMNYYQYLDDRDFILIEQRGTKFSKPHLDCPEWAQAQHELNLQLLSDVDAHNQFVSAAETCRDRLSNLGINLSSYNTVEIAADIVDLISVLEYKQVNLLTISYSTKIAQVLLRDHPALIRSVVMDSPLPLEVNYDQESVSNLLVSVDLLFKDCRNSTSCNLAFPNLRARFLEFLRDKSITPLEINIKHPQNADSVTFRLSGKDLISVFTLASTSDVPNIPYEMNKMLNNDFSSIEAQLAYLFYPSGDGAGIGMRLSVWCAEEFPFNDQEIIQSETAHYPEVNGLSPAVFSESVCTAWNVLKASEIENKPFKSNLPVLFISGEYDNETPVKWAKQMHHNFTNSQHLVFLGWKHTPTTNWGNQCAMTAANQFFNAPFELSQPACLEEITTPTFRID